MNFDPFPEAFAQANNVVSKFHRQALESDDLVEQEVYEEDGEVEVVGGFGSETMPFTLDEEDHQKELRKVFIDLVKKLATDANPFHPIRAEKLRSIEELKWQHPATISLEISKITQHHKKLFLLSRFSCDAAST